jgi:NADPH-dependent 2,4-dienoyl-CoA reductase/sulfur reductase-like enzyme
MPLALPANRSGRVAGENAARQLRGEPVLEPMPPVLGTAITRLFDHGFGRTGFTGDALRGQPVTHVHDTVRNRAHYMPDGAPTEIVLSVLGDGRLVGAQILGSVAEARRIDFFALAIAQGLDTSYAPPFSPV